MEHIEFGFETVKRETKQFEKLKDSFKEYQSDLEKARQAMNKECSDNTNKVKQIQASEKML